MSKFRAYRVGALAVILAAPAYCQFKMPSAGAAIEDAARHSAPSSTPPPVEKPALTPRRSSAMVEVLTETHGIDIQPYLNTMLERVRDEWYSAIHRYIKKPESRRGAVEVEFAVTRSGDVQDIKITKPAADDLDRAVSEALKSVSLPPIPKALPMEQLRFRFHFYYMGKNRLGW